MTMADPNNPRPEEVKLSGAEPEIETDEYQKIFNEETADAGSLDNDALQDRIHKLMEISTITKIRWKAAYIVLNDRIESASNEERERLRKRDMAYKPKEVSAKPRAAKGPQPKDPREKAIAACMNNLGMDRAEAEAFVDKKHKAS